MDLPFPLGPLGGMTEAVNRPAPFILSTPHHSMAWASPGAGGVTELRQVLQEYLSLVEPVEGMGG